MTIIPFELVPGFRQAKRKKGKPIPFWKLVDMRTGRIRCEMSNPEYLQCVIEAILLADTLKSNCAAVGIFTPEMISRESFSD